MKRLLLAAAFLSCIPIANWMIENIGTTCIPHGPCLIPVAPGLMAPSGVLMIGVALALRDACHEAFGRGVVVFMIALGAVLSLAVSPPALALASAVAFGVSETLDFLIYDRLRRRDRGSAVLASGFAGAVLDSMLFSLIAFGTIAWAPGLIIAKVYASAAYAAWLWMRRSATA